MFFSPREHDIISDTKTYIIGNMASNILVWKYLPTAQRSQLLVYNENMEVKVREDADIFLSKDIYQLNFINRQNSFDVIAQIFTRHNFYCQLASFNANGDLLRPVKTLIAKNIPKTYYAGSYDCITSANKKYFALVKDAHQASASDLQLECSIYYVQDTLQNIVQKTISIPYYRDIHTLFSPLHLDNTGNLFFAEYISQDGDSSSHLIVYKSALNSSDYNSCVTDISNKQLSGINIKLDNTKQQCIIYALWSPSNMAAYSDNNYTGIFSWAVNENLESYKKDTSWLLPGVPGLDFKNWQNQSISARDVITLSDNSYTIALTGTDKRENSLYGDNDDVISEYDYINAGDYSAGLYEASNPQVPVTKTTKGSSANASNQSPGYFYTYTGNTPKRNLKNVVPEPPVNANLLLLRFDNASNKIKWWQDVSSNHEINSFSFVNKYSMLNTGESLYFICKKMLTKDKESFENIRLDPDGNIAVKQLMSRDPGYEILVDKGVQVDKHSMVFPCIYQNKTLAFARFELE